MNRSTSLFCFIFLFTFTGCLSGNLFRNIPYTKLDRRLQNLDVQSLYRMSAHSVSDSKLEKQLIVSKDEINYSEYDDAGNYLSITGSVTSGFTSLRGDIDKTPVYEKTIYSKAGKIMYFQKVSEAFASKTTKGVVLRFVNQKFPIGKTYFFNDEGVLTKIRDFDEELRFKIEDVYKFYQQRNISPGVDIDGTSGNWILSFTDYRGNNMIMLNGRTGQVMSERYGIIVRGVD